LAEGLRAELVASGQAVPRPDRGTGESSEKVDERAQRVEALRALLLQGIPEDRRERSDEQQARWLLAYLLDWHRREDKAVWWEYYRLKELPEEELCARDLQVIGRAQE
jgi:hypothetical protein